ncbi:MAG: citrate synthase [Deltaproteobacteria bacterium]|nr:citrate synthase [Deltaproteobacteria bacterium]
MEDILNKIEELAISHDRLTPELIKEKDIKLGLRNPDGTGVMAGITSKGTVIGYKYLPRDDGSGDEKVPSDGKLMYCGYDVADLVNHIHSEKRFGFDEITYLLLTGELPTEDDLNSFSRALKNRRSLTKLERSILMQEAINENQMYALHSLISHFSRCDQRPNSTDIKDVSDRCINLIAKFPTVVAYNYHVMKYRKGANLNIRKPVPEFSTAENFLYLLKGKKPTEFEAYIFDLALMLHAEHGGGNNSTFTVRTVSSSGANTYMAICAGIASLSGHLHGGANEAVMSMMKTIKKNVRDWNDDDEIRAFLYKIINSQANDRTGKIYGMGHAVYTLSDPRAVILREKAIQFSRLKGVREEFRLLDKVAELATQVIWEKKGIVSSPNVDFYSGFIYKLLGIPIELYTPIFAMARVVGWSAHRIEEIIQNKIIRPGYGSSLSHEFEYTPLRDRK